MKKLLCGIGVLWCGTALAGDPSFNTYPSASLGSGNQSGSGSCSGTFNNPSCTTLTLPSLTASKPLFLDGSSVLTVTVPAPLSTSNCIVSGGASLGCSTALPNGTTATSQTASDNSTKVATTAYVDSAVIASNPAVAVNYASTAHLTGSPVYANGVGGIGATITAGSVNTALVVDGHTFVLADITNGTNRVLLKNEGEGGGLGAADNGAYSLTTIQGVAAKWVLTRTLDYDQPGDINNTGSIPVVSGTANAGTGWLISSNVTTIGTDAITYSQYNYAASNTPCLSCNNTFTGTQTFNSTVGTINTQTGTSYTLQASDCGETVYFTSGSAITLTTLNSLVAGCMVSVEQGGAGQITVANGSGATSHSAHSYTKTYGQYALLGLFVDTNAGGAAADFIITGDGA